MNEIKTQEEARQYAIDWQREMSETNISYESLLKAQAEFEVLGEKFNLTEEFKENGII